VVGAGRAVLGDGPAELAEEQHRHPVRQPGRGQVVEERLQGIGELAEEVAVREELGGVSIVARLECVEDGRVLVALEEPGDQLQARGQGAPRIASIIL